MDYRVAESEEMLRSCIRRNDPTVKSVGNPNGHVFRELSALEKEIEVLKDAFADVSQDLVPVLGPIVAAKPGSAQCDKAEPVCQIAERIRAATAALVAIRNDVSSLRAAIDL